MPNTSLGLLLPSIWLQITSRLTLSLFRVNVFQGMYSFKVDKAYGMVEKNSRYKWYRKVWKSWN